MDETLIAQNQTPGQTGKAPKLNVRLLRQVQRHILKNPLRLSMDWFAAALPCVRQAEMPECGTTGCIAGWSIILKDGSMDKAWAYYGSTRNYAATLLGISNEQAGRLFYTENWPLRFETRYIKAVEAKNPENMTKATSNRIDYFIKHRK